jgi:RNA polymerase sigma factor (sigma-70 family)
MAIGSDSFQNDIENLFRAGYNNFVARVKGRVGGAFNAEDVVQEAFTRALTYRSSFDPERLTLNAWFNTILNNACKDFKREEKMQGMTEELTEQNGGLYDLGVEGKDVQRKVEEEIKDYPNKQRDVLTLYYLRGYSRRDVAKVLDVSTNYVKVLSYRFRADFREKYC